MAVRVQVQGLTQLHRTGHSGDQRFETTGNVFLSLRFLNRRRHAIGTASSRGQNGFTRHKHSTTLQHRQPHEILLAQLLSLANKTLSLAHSIARCYFACLLHFPEQLGELVRFLDLIVDVNLRLLRTTAPPTRRP
jgi:hypothetical protein